MLLRFVNNKKEYVLVGTVIPINKETLKLFVKRFEVVQILF